VTVRPRARTWLTCGVLLVGLTAAYHANPTVLLGNDTRPVRFAAVSLLKRGDLDLDEFLPILQEGHPDLPYYLVAARGGHVISRLGIGAPVAAAPVYAVALALNHGKIRELAAARVGKLASSLYVALTAILLYLIARRLASERIALVVALCYGLGSAAFSVVSQALWQHGPAEAFLALGVYLLVRDGPWSVPLAGAAFAAVVVCRPPDATFALAATVYVAVTCWRDRRRRLWGFLLAAAPLAAAQAIYNAVYLGSPLVFAQMVKVVGRDAAPAAAYWSGSFLEGLAGQLVSPSRGLLVYSPIFLLLLWRPITNLRETARPVRYLLGGALLLLVVQARYYGWSGGWTYGYRMLADAVPVLCLALIAPLARLARPGRIVFGALLAVSIAVHAVGAVCYDYRWDMSPNVDWNRGRLWSVRDSQIVYYLGHLQPRRR
jgi:hypothetical protein